jgi:hypothetical protein
MSFFMRNTKIGLIKHTFFNNTLKKDDVSFKEDAFSLAQLRTEFSSLYQVLMSNKPLCASNKELVFYTSYLCDLMICYYQHDYVRADLQKLIQQQKEIEALLGDELIKNEQEFNYFSSLLSITELRKYVGQINTSRSKFTYSRSLASYTIVYLQKSSFSAFIREVNKKLGNQYSFIDGVNFLNESRELTSNLGIVLYAARFIMHLILVIKHVILAATNDKLSAKKVFKQEMQKRGFTMASDLVWATVGLLTTYNNFFHISASFVSPIILTFLTFDTLLFLAQWLFESSQYHECLRELIVQKEDASPFEQVVIQRQIDMLNDEWAATCSYYAINILAANLLAACFAVSMICTGPLALAGVALLNMLGNALYNASEEYKRYKKAKIAIERELHNGSILDATESTSTGYDSTAFFRSNGVHHQELLKILNKECKERYIHFWKTLAFNVGGIAFIITAAVASWPIALGLTFCYLTYCANNAHQKQLEKNNKEAPSHDIYRLLLPEQSETSVLECFYC